MSNPEEKQGISALDFFCIGFGAIVGVGWAVSINSWMADCGGPVPASLGYLVVLIFMIPISMTYAELVPMLPVAGGGAAFAYAAFGEKVSFLSGWATFGAFVSFMPWEAIQLTDVLGYLFPGLKSGQPLYQVLGSDVYGVTILLGALFSLALYALNRKGLQSAAALQKFLCVFLVAAAAIGAVAGLMGGDLGNLTPVYDPTVKTVTHKSLFGGMMAILGSAAFFLAGFETIPQGVEEAGGDIREVGKTVVLSVGFACLFYAVLLFCFGYAWPWQEFLGMERPAAASLFRELFPGAVGTGLYWLLIIGAIAGLFTSWNGFYGASANLLMALARARMVPALFARQNQKGIPVNGLILGLILSILGPFLGANMIDTVTCFSALAFVVSWTVTALSLVRLRRTMPNAPRPFRLPTPVAWFAAVASCVYLVGMLLPMSPFFVGKIALVAFLGYYALGVLLYLVSGRRRGELTAKEREKNMFGKLDLDAMREGGRS